MTGIAGLQVERGNIGSMTIGTNERFIRDLELVSFQGEAHRLMRELSAAQVSETGICAAVFGVAKAAAQIRLIGQQRTVQRGDILHLHGNLTVTRHTTIFHFGCFPGGRMAGFTVSAGLRMGGNAAQHLSALSVQRTRAVQYPALSIDIAGND